MSDLAEAAVKADLASGNFTAGVVRGSWKLLSYEFPFFVIAVSATEPDQTLSEYAFQYKGDDFPTKAPMVQIWDVQNNCVLPLAKRPKGNARVVKAFQHWQHDTVYRPWERMSLDHGDWRTMYEHQAWRLTMTLTYTVEDLYALLNGNARKAALLAAAQA